jgi:hypothetical protein
VLARLSSSWSSSIALTPKRPAGVAIDHSIG